MGLPTRAYYAPEDLSPMLTVPISLRRLPLRAAPFAALALAGACVSPVWNVELDGDYQEVVSELVHAVEEEMSTKGIPALSIALVDGDRVVWAQGFGVADPLTGKRATADTVFRVGSISKLFTDVALMQLVEQGRVDLDVPVSTYLPDFQPISQFDKPITLRHLTSHTSGLLREPPVGNYFEMGAPSLEETVRSLNETSLVFAPGTVTKYSNAGLAVVGRVIEVLYDAPYREVMTAQVLKPMGTSQTSAFSPSEVVADRLARGQMWTCDGRTFPAPTFQLGMAPAGSLYSSVLDLTAFIRILFSQGVGPAGRLLQPQTLRAMLTPARGPDGRPQPFGVGFFVDELDGHRRAGHDGALYGFSTQLSFLPDDQLGVVVAASLDGCNTVTERLSTHALRLMLAARARRPLPRLAESRSVSPARAKDMVGLYELDGRRARVTRCGDRLVLETRGLICEVRDVGGRLTVDDRHSFGPQLERIDGDRIAIGGVPYTRVDESEAPPPCPERLKGFIGEYGWDHNKLFIREEGGRLEALIEWFWFEPLTELAPDRFALPRRGGLYPAETLSFQRDKTGRITHALLGAVAFERRPVGDPGAETFRIEPLYDEAHLRLLLAGATPPVESGKLDPDLVDVATVDPTIRFDLRYATTNNFMGMVFYPEARAFLQRPAAEALARASQKFARLGYGILVHDAYRPWHVTKMFWDATPEPLRQFVADPSEGSRHNRGCGVDLTLYDLQTGEVVRTTSGYDEFSSRAYPGYPGGTSRQRWYRDTIRTVMEAAGFRVYQWEWWHYDFDGWREYPILDLSFDEIDPAQN